MNYQFNLDGIVIPKFLMDDDRYKDIGVMAMFLYGVMLDRFLESIRKGIKDDDNNWYFVMGRQDIADVLKCDVKTAIKIVNELKKYKLINDKRKSRKLSYIYILMNDNVHIGDGE